MKRNPCVKDFSRKIKVVFYPKYDRDLDEIRAYFDDEYYELRGVKIFNDINTTIFEQIPDLVVCTDNFHILSPKIKKYIYYVSLKDILYYPKETCSKIRKQAYQNYLDKIKGQMEVEIRNEKEMSSKIMKITNFLSLKDYYLRDHSIRVMNYSLMIGKVLNLEEEDMEQLKYSCLLHDIGKIALPYQIVSKPSDYLPKEEQFLKYHTLIADYLLKFNGFQKIRRIIKYHHERIDGRGYLKKRGIEEIPLLSRILAVADSFDLLTTSTFYGIRMNYEEAISKLEQESRPRKSKLNVQMYDTEIVDILKECINTINIFPDMNKLLDISLKNNIIIEKTPV